MESGTLPRCEMERWLEGLARSQRERKVLILADSKAAIAAVRKAGRTGKARSSHLRKVVAEIEARGPGMEKVGWVKAHMGILGNQAADVLAERAAEGVPPDDCDKWMLGGGIWQWTKQRKMEYVEGEEEGIITRAMGWKRKAVTNYCRLRGAKGTRKWWENKIGESAVCPRRREEEESLEHVVFRCMGVRRLKDTRGRRGVG